MTALGPIFFNLRQRFGKTRDHLTAGRLLETAAGTESCAFSLDYFRNA
jgi:hypothetical protein